MIENDRVLFLPAEVRNRAEVVVIKKVTRQARAAIAIERSVNKFRRQVDERGGKLRQVQQRAAVNSGTKLLPQGINQSVDPTVGLSAVNPRRDMSTRFD